MKDENKPVRSIRRRIILIIICVILSLFFAALLFATAYVHHLLSLINISDDSYLYATLSPEQLEALRSDPDHDPNFTGPSITPEEIPVNTVPSTPQEEVNGEDVINIMLIGDDTRQSQIRQRSDAMILCSFNVKTNTLTMTSFLRDTYIPQIPGFWADKLNAAYAYGGLDTMDKTFAAYFGVDIDAHVIVQFDGFKGVIDMLGGVDIEMTEAEVKHLMSFSPWKLTVGVNHLTGEQALAYARIRKIDMDAMRAQRQRNVLTALINAYKNKSVAEMLTLTSKILESGFIQTDMTSAEVLDYVSKLFPKLKTTTINNLQIPADGTYESMTVGNITATKVCDFEANRKLLEDIIQ